MSMANEPTGPMWSTAQFIAAFLWVGSILTFGGLPLTLLILSICFLIIRFGFRMLKISATGTRDGLAKRAALRRSERLKATIKQAQSLVQVAPRISQSNDYGEIAGLLSNISGIEPKVLKHLQSLNAAEQKMLDTVQILGRTDPAKDSFVKTITDAQDSTSAFLTSLSKTPSLPAPELANNWLSFHEETRMSVQEINNGLAILNDKAQAITALENQLQEDAKTVAQDDISLDINNERPLSEVVADLGAKLTTLPENTKPKTFQELFELSQVIDAAFTTANRQPPHKLALVADDVRRVHQIETLLSVYREKMQKLDEEQKAGTIDDSTYATMKSTWERALESELSSLESTE